MPRQDHFEGILSSCPTSNPDFHSWNRVLLKYCDGGSFYGDVIEPMKTKIEGLNPPAAGGGPLFYRGLKIWEAMMEELMEKGMRGAHQVLLGGCSAGGVSALLRCDQIRELMPKQTVVKCLCDAGFFIDVQDVGGGKSIEALFEGVVRQHNIYKNLPESCTIFERGVTGTSSRNSSCFFPENLIKRLETPIFVINSAYDFWQIGHSLVPPSADPGRLWEGCKAANAACSESQLEVLQGFRDGMLKRLQPVLEREKDGAFIDSCYFHCQSRVDEFWSGGGSPRVDGKSMAQIVGDWFFERNSTKAVDCPFPCNAACGIRTEPTRLQ